MRLDDYFRFADRHASEPAGTAYAILALVEAVVELTEEVRKMSDPKDKKTNEDTPKTPAEQPVAPDESGEDVKETEREHGLRGEDE